tara:strand:+ start:261 stop:1370 length:1110 start_codon:yes stop_codon:yes gene_type:complete
MNKKILVIGSGFISFSFLSKLVKRNLYKIYLSIDNRNELIRFTDNIQINRYLGHMGTSKYWHSVSPSNGPVGYFKFFKSFYNINENIKLNFKNENKIYIPRKKPNLNKAFGINIYNSNFNLIHSYTRKVSKKKNKIEVVFGNNNKIIVDKIFVGTNILDLEKIIFNKIRIPNYTIYDHIQTHVGFIDNKHITNKSLIKPFITSNGYYIGYESYKNKILMLRPYHSNIKNFNFKNFQNFGKSSFEIILEILFSFSFNKLISAFSTKYGFFFKSKFYSIYVQEKIKYDKITLVNQLSKTEIKNKIRGFNSISFNNLNKTTGISIYGNHQIGESNDISDNQVIFGNIKPKGWLKGTHHTILNCFDVFNKNID